MSRPKDLNIQELIDYAQGTCNSLDEVCTEFGMESDFDLTEDDHTEIDNQIFVCDTCGWWCEISEACNELEDCGGTDCTDCCEENHPDD